MRPPGVALNRAALTPAGLCSVYMHMCRTAGLARLAVCGLLEDCARRRGAARLDAAWLDAALGLRRGAAPARLAARGPPAAARLDRRLSLLGGPSAAHSASHAAARYGAADVATCQVRVQCTGPVHRSSVRDAAKLQPPQPPSHRPKPPQPPPFSSHLSSAGVAVVIADASAAAAARLLPPLPMPPPPSARASRDHSAAESPAEARGPASRLARCAQLSQRALAATGEGLGLRLEQPRDTSNVCSLVGGWT